MVLPTASCFFQAHLPPTIKGGQTLDRCGTCFDIATKKYQHGGFGSPILTFRLLMDEIWGVDRYKKWYKLVDLMTFLTGCVHSKWFRISPSINRPVSVSIPFGSSMHPFVSMFLSCISCSNFSQDTDATFIPRFFSQHGTFKSPFQAIELSRKDHLLVEGVVILFIMSWKCVKVSCCCVFFPRIFAP